jgi:predicted TIM-barrel fold metal-dependent hydrolase
MSIEMKEAGIQNVKKLRYIDCDVHPFVEKIDRLFPYMTEGWKNRFALQGINIGSLRLPDRYAHPAGGTLRIDATPPSGGRPGSDPEFVCRHYLDPYDPVAVVLNPLQPAGLAAWSDVDAVNALVAAFNDYYINEWLPLDKRYKYALVVTPQDPQHAAAEIRRLGGSKGVVAVFLSLMNILMGNKHYHPIYEASIEMGLPVITHVSGTECSYHGVPVVAGGSPSSYIERYVDLIQVAQSNVSSLIFEGIFEKYPSLRVGFVEHGFSWLLALTWRMDKAWKELRVETPWVKKLPSDYIRRHIRLTTQPLDEPEREKDLIELIGKIHGEEILMFSSDYPHWDNDMPTRVLNGLSEETKQRILYKNAEAFYAL